MTNHTILSKNIIGLNDYTFSLKNARLSLAQDSVWFQEKCSTSQRDALAGRVVAGPARGRGPAPAPRGAPAGGRVPGAAGAPRTLSAVP